MSPFKRLLCGSAQTEVPPTSAASTSHHDAPPLARRDRRHRRARPPWSTPRARLVREWGGETHEVIVVENGFEWRGARWKSLSSIASEITGAHWSGPWFFGLTSRGRPAPTEEADNA
jgi:hypothetical protein